MTKLYSYQRVGVDIITENDGSVLLADDAGIGKTLQILTAIAENDWTAVVVCPSTAKAVWKKQALQHLGEKVDMLGGTRSSYNDQPARITVINYDVLVDWVGHIKHLDPDIIIFDEGHALCNPATQRWEAARELSMDRACLIATGTPVVNSEADLTSLQLLIGNRVIIRRKKRDVLQDLPAARRVIVPVAITERGHYDDCEGDFLAWLRRYDREALAGAQKAVGLAKVGCLRRLVGRLKRQAVASWLERLEGKRIVFTCHRAMLSSLMTSDSVFIDGSRTASQRAEAISRFSSSSSCDTVLCNIIAGGTAWQGTAARTTVITEIPFTWAALAQAECRVNRIGQEDTTTSYILLAEGTVEERFWSLIEMKRDLSAILLGD